MSSHVAGRTDTGLESLWLMCMSLISGAIFTLKELTVVTTLPLQAKHSN